MSLNMQALRFSIDSGFRLLQRFFESYYKLDLRSLALMRIGMACVIISDLMFRFTDIRALYCDEGMWPVKLMYNLGWKDGFWSLHALSGTYTWTFFLFVLHVSFALSLLLGFYTRLSTFVVWVLYISLHNRNLFVLQSGDDLLRLLLFWALFLPWGSRYSIDAIKDKSGSGPSASASLGYLMLMASVYLFTAVLKSDPDWHSERSALYYALSLEEMRRPGFGDLLYQQANLLQWLTPIVYGLELVLPVLMLWPSKKGLPRGVAFLLILILQLAIGLSLYVGHFFLISICSAFALIPGSVLDKWATGLAVLGKKPEWSSSATSHKHNQLIATFLILVMALCFFLNLSTLNWFPLQANKALRTGLNFLRLNQNWAMFSPGILRKGGWFVYHGLDSLGRQWDMRRNCDYVDYKEPEKRSDLFRNDRWRKLSENMQNEKFIFLRHLYGNYYLKNWNREHPEKKIKTLNLYFMEQENLEHYHKSEARKILYVVSTEP